MAILLAKYQVDSDPIVGRQDVKKPDACRPDISVQLDKEIDGAGRRRRTIYRNQERQHQNAAVAEPRSVLQTADCTCCQEPARDRERKPLGVERWLTYNRAIRSGQATVKQVSLELNAYC